MELTKLAGLLIYWRDEFWIIPFDFCVRKAIVQFSVKKIKRHGRFPAFLIKRLDICRIINLLLWIKKCPILHAYIVLNSTWYNGINQGICRNSDLLAVPNPFILIPVESYQCIAVLGLFEITWWSLFTFLVKKKKPYQSLETVYLGGFHQLALQVEVNWTWKPVVKADVTGEIVRYWLGAKGKLAAAQQFRPQ